MFKVLRPFDVWLLMKDEEDIATAGGQKARGKASKVS